MSAAQDSATDLLSSSYLSDFLSKWNKKKSAAFQRDALLDSGGRHLAPNEFFGKNLNFYLCHAPSVEWFNWNGSWAGDIFFCQKYAPSNNPYTNSKKYVIFKSLSKTTTNNDHPTNIIIWQFNYCRIRKYKVFLQLFAAFSVIFKWNGPFWP